TEITQEGSLKRAGDELEQEISKKQKVDDDKESEELKKCLEIIPDDGDDPDVGAAVAWLAEGTYLVVAPDVFSTTVANLFKLFNLVNLDGSSFSAFGKQLAKSCKVKSFENLVLKKLPEDQTEVIEPEPLTLEFEPILEMEDEGLKCIQVYYKKKHECMESLGADNPRSALVVESVEASCSNADSECK
nr:hypothetical protein [Tanacetum cinerariifolium]